MHISSLPCKYFLHLCSLWYSLFNLLSMLAGIFLIESQETILDPLSTILCIISPAVSGTARLAMPNSFLALARKMNMHAVRTFQGTY